MADQVTPPPTSASPSVRAKRSTKAVFAAVGGLILIQSCVVDPAEEGNTPPVATITEPVAGATFAAGDEVPYSGSGQDAEDGALPPQRLTWWIDFHHDDHAHPFLPKTSGTGGTVIIPTVGEVSDNVWYRFYLEAVDGSGVADTVFREIQPLKSTMTFETVPAGLEVLLDGQPHTTPFAVPGVVGFEREIAVISPQTQDGTVYEFSSWSDGGTQTHRINTPADDATFRATFTAAGAANEPPTVSITSPAPAENIVVNTTVTVTAAADDSDGSVTGVEFFADGASIGSVTSAPYAVSWTPSQVGTVRLTARATDDDDATTDADPVDVAVISGGGGDNTPPTVTITAPLDGSTNLFDPLAITAEASDDVGVAGVQFQLDGEDIGPEDTTAPFEVPLPDTDLYASGIHVIRARARDAAGNLSDWAVSTVTFGGSVALPQGFGRTDFVDGLPLTTTMAFAPDGRLFIAQLDGNLRVVENGTLLSQPFVTLPVATGGEFGLLGVTFHPDFGSNGWVYVTYTTTQNGTHNRVSRFTANGNVAESGSEVIIADLPALTAGGHLAGALHFGPDGALYVAVGENGTPTNAPDLSSLFGKMLRLNDDGSIPSDNPFLDVTTGLNQAIWARGLRNPFTFGFQPGTGRIFINDVGEASWEEINEGTAGADYGWPTTEGPTTDQRFVSPVYAYPQSGALLTGASIVGAAFYSPASTSFPSSYEGDYFFADFVDGWVTRLDLDADNAAYAFAQLPGFITDLRVGPDGALYVLGQINGGWGVHRIGATP